MTVVKDKYSWITQAYLKAQFVYEPDTGHLIRRTRQGKAGKGTIGSIAGNKGGNRKYIQVMIDRRQYTAHRLIWLYVYGVWPKNLIDHINGVKNDNRLVNLREATRSQNQGNSGLKKSNTSGYRGVFWDKKLNNWRVRFRGGHFGNYSDIVEAAAAYEAAYVAFYGEFSRAA